VAHKAGKVYCPALYSKSLLAQELESDKDVYLDEGGKGDLSEVPPELSAG